MSKDEDPTLVDGAPPAQAAPTTRVAAASVRPSEPRGLTASAGGLRTTEATVILRREEASRTAALMRLVAPVAAVGFGALWVPRAGLPLREVAAVVFAATFLVTVWLIRRFRDPERYEPRLALAQGLLCVASILMATVHVGVFSPTIMAACVGIYFFGLSDSLPAGWAIFLCCTVGYLLLAVLAISGILPLDRAVVAVEHPDRAGLVALAACAEVLLCLTFWMARRSRLATREAFERLERAAHQIRRGDALLAEARAELDQAKAANVGRYTDRRIGDYSVFEIIGRGAMGEVYRGLHEPKNRAVALKFLHQSVREDPELLERFFREARVATAIRSPHVVEVLELGSADDGAPFIAMELLDGQDLAQRLRGAKRLALADVVELVGQVSQALMLADESRVVHRDLKPQNLLAVESRGRVTWKVLDFGVSKIRESAATLTHGAIIGTPSYMSPEQARGQPVDHRSDVFSLAVIAYRCLTGRPAFTGPDSATTIYNVVHVQPARPSELATVEPDVERVLALGLAKDPSRRFATASMLATALTDAAKGRLDERLRRDADLLLDEQPWGADLAARRRMLAVI